MKIIWNGSYFVLQKRVGLEFTHSLGFWMFVILDTTKSILILAYLRISSWGLAFPSAARKPPPCMPHPGWAIFAYQWQTHKEHEEFIACWFWIGVTQHVDPAQLLAKNNRKILWQVTSRVSIYTLRYAKNACCGESNCLLRRISDLSTSLQVVQNVSTRKSFILLEGKKPFW